jgi:hypothetical protein
MTPTTSATDDTDDTDKNARSEDERRPAGAAEPRIVEGRAISENKPTV